MSGHSKPGKTFADYVAIALCPLLIMLLVGSLAFFLLQIGYKGGYDMRLRWAIGWFVLGAVLISRISIRDGSEYALMYALLLGGAIGFFIWRIMHGQHYVAWGILAIIWWCTSKLTWDCTLIDDDEDASGEGLLQASGLQMNRENGEAAEATDDKPVDKRREKWRKQFSKRANKSGKAHAPGRWVVYFSLAALPLFGIGQAVMQSYYTEQRNLGFKFLWVYVASALGLLLLTSFLGLRRYLRQRYLQMPGGVTATWVFIGTLLTAAILAATLLLPRPDGTYDWGNLRDRVEDTFFGKASKYAATGGQAGEGEGKRIGTDETGKMANKDAENAKDSKEKADGKVDGKDASQEGKGDARQGGNQAEKAGGQKQGPDGSQGGDKGNTMNEHEMAGKTEPAAAPSVTSSTSFWWIIAVVAVALLGLAIWKRKAILNALDNLLAIWRRLRGGGVVSAVSTRNQELRPRRFSEFQDPFTSGTDQSMSPEEIIGYTYDALQAWAREHKFPPHPEDTPAEFSEGLGLKFPAMADELGAVSELYAKVAYAGQKASMEELQSARWLWRIMSESATGDAVPVAATADATA